MREARSLILGVDEPVPTLDGRLLPYINRRFLQLKRLPGRPNQLQKWGSAPCR